MSPFCPPATPGSTLDPMRPLCPPAITARMSRTHMPIMPAQKQPAGFYVYITCRYRVWGVGVHTPDPLTTLCKIAAGLFWAGAGRVRHRAAHAPGHRVRNIRAVMAGGRGSCAASSRPRPGAHRVEGAAWCGGRARVGGGVEPPPPRGSSGRAHRCTRNAPRTPCGSPYASALPSRLPPRCAALARLYQPSTCEYCPRCPATYCR